MQKFRIGELVKTKQGIGRITDVIQSETFGTLYTVHFENGRKAANYSPERLEKI